MVFGIADMNFGLGDVNSYTTDAVYVHASLAPLKVGCGKGRPLKIITDNSAKTVVFGATSIPHPCNQSVL